MDLTPNQAAALIVLNEAKDKLSSAQVHLALDEVGHSIATGAVTRALTDLDEAGFATSSGIGVTVYRITKPGRREVTKLRKVAQLAEKRSKKPLKVGPTPEARGPGRPPLPEKERRISRTVRWTPPELNAVEKAAKKAKLSVSEYVRGRVLRGLKV